MWKGISYCSTALRQIHTGIGLEAVEKAALSKLRKKTGFTFVNCKKALEKFDSDIAQAEVWLREQAQKEGWAKASKLQGRPMSQGLVGVTIENNMAAMVEANCETDFVARNQKFQDLLSKAVVACLQLGKNNASDKVILDKEALNKLEIEGKSLQDHVAMEVGNIGENMALRRAVFMKAPEQSIIGSYVHTTGPHVAKHSTCVMGKFGAISLFTHDSTEKDSLSKKEVGRQLCQHIVGMNPKSIGNVDDVAAKNKDEESIIGNVDAEATKNKDEDSTIGNVDDEATKNKDEDSTIGNVDDEATKNKDEESKMLLQEFLLDQDITVQEFLQQNNAKIQDFLRFECGEPLGEEIV